MGTNEAKKIIKNILVKASQKYFRIKKKAESLGVFLYLDLSWDFVLDHSLGPLNYQNPKINPR